VATIIEEIMLDEIRVFLLILYWGIKERMRRGISEEELAWNEVERLVIE
jgi:hypothetical protein